MRANQRRHRQRWDPRYYGSANLQAWYDTTLASTVTIVSGNISQLNDRSTFARDIIQPTPGNRPAFNATLIGGQPGAAFVSASSQFLYRLTANWGAAIPQPFTIFLIGYSTQDATHGAYSNPDTGNPPSLFVGTSSHVFASGGTQIGPGTFNTTTPCVFCTVYNTTASAMYINNASTPVIAAANDGSNTFAGLALGHVGGTSFWNGGLSEMFIVSGALDATARGQGLSYLGTKYGISTSP